MRGASPAQDQRGRDRQMACAESQSQRVKSGIGKSWESRQPLLSPTNGHTVQAWHRGTRTLFISPVLGS